MGKLLILAKGILNTIFVKRQFFILKFSYQPNDSTSIGANYINTNCEEDHGNNWVNLVVGIISKYDKVTKRFFYYKK